MDILYGTSCLPAFRRTEIPPGNQRPSGIVRLFVALAVIAVMVGLLGHDAGRRSGPSTAASVAAPSETGVLP